MSSLDAVIPLPVQTLLDLFSTELKELRFPDLDGARLAAAAERVQENAAAVAEAEAALASAQALLADSQDALLQKAQRALAYLRVYAEENAALTERLSAISLPRAQRKVARAEPAAESATGEPAASRRRGRPRKEATDPLFSSDGAPPADA